MAETIYIKGENGVVVAHDLPLGEGIADRLTKGHLRRVNPDGTDWSPSEVADDVTGAPVTTKPATSALKPEWVGWAVTQGATPDDAEAMTKADLIEKYGK